jgi:hypothetical protein
MYGLINRDRRKYEIESSPSCKWGVCAGFGGGVNGLRLNTERQVLWFSYDVFRTKGGEKQN